MNDFDLIGTNFWSMFRFWTRKIKNKQSNFRENVQIWNEFLRFQKKKFISKQTSSNSEQNSSILNKFLQVQNKILHFLLEIEWS